MNCSAVQCSVVVFCTALPCTATNIAALSNNEHNNTALSNNVQNSTATKCTSIHHHYDSPFIFFIFIKSANWADSIIELQCPSVCLSVCPFSCDFFQGLSLALRSHDQIPASHWSTLLPYHMVVVGGGGLTNEGP